jgi:integrative and conjugative element protein (TIGR02256 family)
VRANAIEIATAAYATMMHLAHESSDGLETGGILLGRGPDEHGVIRIESAGDRGPNAERRVDYFLRDLEHAKVLAAMAWERSRAIWVGEWHTHPKGPPEPSSSDLATYHGLLSRAELQFESFVSIILTPDKELGWRRPRMTRWLLEMAIEPANAASDGLDRSIADTRSGEGPLDANSPRLGPSLSSGAPGVLEERGDELP